MARPKTRSAILKLWFEQYLENENTTRFLERVTRRYSTATLERLAVYGPRLTRRAAVMALGLVGGYDSNPVLGRALHDSDRGVRMLADNGIRLLWCRAGTEAQCRVLDSIVQLNTSSQHQEAAELATELIEEVASFAEAWNQRAIAFYCEDLFGESIFDCNQALELNPYHFGAAAGMGQCYLKLGDQVSALECFQRALKLNPNLEGVRANVIYLKRALKGGQR